MLLFQDVKGNAEMLAARELLLGAGGGSDYVLEVSRGWSGTGQS